MVSHKGMIGFGGEGGDTAVNWSKVQNQFWASTLKALALQVNCEAGIFKEIAHYWLELLNVRIISLCGKYHQKK